MQLASWVYARALVPVADNCHEQAELTDASVFRVVSLGIMGVRDGNLIDRGFNNIGVRPTINDLGVDASNAFGPLSPTCHNGDALTLNEVVELYSRGGNVFPVLALDGTVIVPLGVPSLTSDEIDAFLVSLTDERVLYRRAPFDHPQIFVPNGVGCKKDGKPSIRLGFSPFSRNANKGPFLMRCRSILRAKVRSAEATWLFTLEVVATEARNG